MTDKSKYQKYWRSHHRKHVRYVNDRSATRRFIRHANDDDLHQVIRRAVNEQRSRPDRVGLIENKIIETWPERRFDKLKLDVQIKAWLKRRPEKTVYQSIDLAERRLGHNPELNPLTEVFNLVVHPVRTDTLLSKDEEERS